MTIRKTIACIVLAVGLLCGCHDHNIFIIGNGNGEGEGGDGITNVTLALSPVVFNDIALDEEQSMTRTLSYDFVYGDKTKGGSVTSRWDTINSVGVFPIAPDSNSQVKYTFRSERVEANTTSYKGQGWNLKSDNTYASYYPYQDLINTKSSKDIPMSFHDQKQVYNSNADHLDGINNIYYATAHRPETADNITFTYKRAAGLLWVRLIAPKLDLLCGSLTIASYDGKKIFTDSATVNVATGEITRVKTSDRTVLHFDSLANRVFENGEWVNKIPQEGDTLNFYLTMAPLGKTLAERKVPKLAFELRCNTKIYYSSVSNAETPTANNGIWFTLHPSTAKRVHVDMGLPSGIQWAECNLGALLPTDHGYYFTWGGTYPSSECFWTNYVYNLPDTNGGSVTNLFTTASNLKKYTIEDEQYYGRWYDKTHTFVGDGKRVLEPSDDAAVEQLGSNNAGYWDMPTREQFQELCDNSTFTWVDDYRGSGVNGYLCTSKINKNSIFFPAAGYMGKENETDDISDQKSYYDADRVLVQENARGFNSAGYYWTRSLSDHYSTDAYEFKFNQYVANNYVDKPYTVTTAPIITPSKRYLGQSIRPVFHPKK